MTSRVMDLTDKSDIMDIMEDFQNEADENNLGSNETDLESRELISNWILENYKPK